MNFGSFKAAIVFSSVVAVCLSFVTVTYHPKVGWDSGFQGFGVELESFMCFGFFVWGLGLNMTIQH